MSKVDDMAAGFTISGLLDSNTSTRKHYPVEEVELNTLQDHPGNAVYSMEPSGIKRLAAAIIDVGMTDIPLARRLPTGELQMISGHRRKAAYKLLARDNPTFEKIPVRIAEDIDDAQAIIMLHAANYHTRELSVIERAAASKALEQQVEQLRESDPELSGVRTDDIKAALISSQGGKPISGKTIQRQEALAVLVTEKLNHDWQQAARENTIPDKAIRKIAAMNQDEQARAYEAWAKEKPSRRQTLGFLEAFIASEHPEVAKPDLTAADAALARFLNRGLPLNDADRNVLASITERLRQIEESR